MLLFAGFAAVCLCVPVYGLAGTEQKSNEFLFLLGEFNQLREKVHSLETQLSKDVNVHMDLSESQPCQSGKVEFIRDFSNRTVKFSKPFSRIPAVTYGMTLLDSSHHQVTRARCDISNVSATGFDVICRTWNKSIIYNIYISWMAC